jgi:uncharacterized phage-associated protein
MGYDGRMVANFILDFCEQRGRTVTNLALQKIVYFCHVWSLIVLGRPLVRHKFEAWEFGPVLPYLYREFKELDRAVIDRRATHLDPVDGRKKVVEYRFDSDTDRLLRDVVDFYSQLAAGDLVKLSHTKGGPWYTVWHHRGAINPGMKIDDTEVANFYSKARPPCPVQ